MKLATIALVLPQLFIFAKCQDFEASLWEKGRNSLRHTRAHTGTEDGTFGNGVLETSNGRFGNSLLCAPGAQPDVLYKNINCEFTMDTLNAGTTATLYMNAESSASSSDFDCTATATATGQVMSCSLTSATDEGAAMYYDVDIDGGFFEFFGGNYTCTYETSDCHCFSGDSVVDVRGKGPTLMKDLQVGEKILVGKSYETVYEFAHLEKTKSAQFLQIFTDQSEEHGPLEITEDHLLPVNNKFLPAHLVRVGDTLSGKEGSSVVTKVHRLTKKGMFAPLTPSGVLLVNGVKVSSYAWIEENTDLWLTVSSWLPISYHTASHMAFSPLRMACLGISSRLCTNDLTDDETGHPPFVKFWLNVVKQKYVAILALLFVLICGPLYLMELIFGAALAPFAIVCLAGVVTATRATGRSKKRGFGLSHSKSL